MKKHIAIVPAYEPDEQLKLTVDRLLERAVDVVVIDDGSGQDYAHYFDALPPHIHLISYPINGGKGHALKEGFAYVKGQYGEDCVVVTVDSDGQHGTGDVMRVLAKAEENPDKLILGSRLMNKSAPLRSRLGNGITRFVYRLTTGVGVYDTQTGLRAFSGSLLDLLLSIPGERYEYEMNVLLECARRKLPMEELPIETIYIDNNSASHFDVVKDSLRIYKDIFKFAASSFASFIVDYLMYSLLILCTGALGSSRSVVVSNIGARIVSATVNYTLNRKYVFKSEKSVVKSAIEYFLLAVLILAGNTLVLNFFVNTLFFDRFAAKLLTEILFFAVSWLIQKFVIF